jgi:predicted dehydrogenase
MSIRSLTTSRRAFLKAAAAAAACPYVIPASALGADGRPPASERVVLGGIGIGNQGNSDQKDFLDNPDVQYVAVCDVRKNHREGAQNRANDHYHNKDCKAYNDFRDLLARNDIDAVHVATPDHWHAIIVIEACRSGKDVFCQKPETRTLREGKLMVDAARRYGRVVSGGSQRVLEDYRRMVERCWGGEIGTIKSINVNEARFSGPCNLPPQPVPPEIDWDLWLGPAPWAPYNKGRCDGNFGLGGGSWRSYSDYSGGGMTDWGAHHFGGATFAADVRELQPVEVVYNDERGKKYLTFRYANGLLLYNNGPDMGNVVAIGTGEKRPPKPVPGYKGPVKKISGDFIHCVKTREKPFRDIQYAVNTVTVCHLGVLAYELQRSLKWDPAKQEFPGDEEANRFVDRARRQPWVL